MKNITKVLLVALMLVLIPMKHFGQTPYRQYADDGILLNFHEIDNVDFRVFLLYNLCQDNRFALIANEEPGQFSISLSEEVPLANLRETFDAFFHNNYADFGLLSKNDISSLMPSWKDCIPPQHFLSITMDIALRNSRPVNNHCADSDPFCTSDVITFDAATTSQTADQLEGTTIEDGCIGSSYNPSWFHMRIQTGGQFIIHVEGHDPNNGTNRDVDFCMWGPYTDPTSPCVAQLTTNKIIDCSFSAAYFEDIYLGYPGEQHSHGSSGTTSHGTINYHMPVAGEYYILMITNYSRQPCTISFTKTPNSGPGETDCGILPGIATNDGPYCVGETINLTVNSQVGATYSWTGPNGFSSNQQNPTRPNCTMAMAGTYTCVTTVGSQTTSGTTEVIVYPQPTANFTFTSVCEGSATQFNSTSTTNPSGQQIQSLQWNFGDGQTGTGQSVNHTYASAGNYTVTLTASCGNGRCTSHKTETVPVYAAPRASATAQPNTVIYGGVATLTANAGTTGSFNFHWEPANMVVNPDNQTTQTVPLQATQTFTVTVTNPQGGCSSSAQVTVSMEGSNMTALVSADQYELCEGESTTLHASPSGGTGTYTYNWTPANTLNNATSQNPVATPPVGSNTYTCTVSDGITDQNVSVTIIVHPNEETDIYETVCENSYFNFFGENLQSPGIYDHTIETQYGCDSTIHLHLSNWDIYETPITRHFCQGESYDFFGQPLGIAGTYYHTLESVHGCDSVIKLNLVQDPRYELELWESTCEGGQGYYYDGDYWAPSEEAYIFHYNTILGCDSTVFLHVEEAEYNSKSYSVSLCATEYTWASNGQTYYETGTYYDTLSYPNSCDSTLTLYLELRPSFNNDVVETSCDSYRWNNDVYQVDMTFTESTVYTHHYVNSFGCNSEVTLYLTINDHDEHSFTLSENESCDSFYWDPQGHEIVYTDHEDLEYNFSGTYHRTYKNIYNCDSLVTMNVQFEYTPSPTEIYPMDAQNTAPHWVVTATEFQINSYDFNLWDTNPNCHWDSVTWTCDEAPTWVLERFGDKGQCCKVYVLNHVDDTIWLKAHAFNRCAPESGIEQKYWLVCSFYGVDENGPSTSSETFDFNVIPNPNNGQMTLSFDHLTGKVNVRVYDMRGTLIDKFQTYSGNGPSTLDYDMKSKADGIYFFVVTAKEGTAARKVVIQH